MDLWNSFAGMVEAELTSAEPEAALVAANERNIVIFSVQRISDLTVRFRILRRDYRSLADLCKKRGEHLRLVKRRGLYWFGKRLLKRPMLLVGMAILLGSALLLPTRVLFVRVEGNVSVPGNQILAAAEECGIRFFASRREVRSEKMKNALLSAVPQLQWAGVNTAGCVATISVRERTEPEEEKRETMLGSIVADRDGYILSCTATRGNLLCRPTQTVSRGQVLISGYTDCGICIRATGAEGEVFAQTNRCLTVISPLTYQYRAEPLSTSRKYSLIIGKKRINLWKGSGIWDASCGRMYEEYYITLPGGFQLPVALAVEEYACYETVSAEMAPEDAEEMLKDFAADYLRAQMVAGSILSRDEAVLPDAGVYRLEGEYVCSEMIGRLQQEQIGEYNGEDR